MKRNMKWLLAAACCLAMAGCGKQKAAEPADGGAPGARLDSVSCTDSLLYDGNRAVCKINVVYPADTGAVGDSVRLWIAQQLACNYADESRPMFAVGADAAGDVPATVRLAADSLLASSRRDFAAFDGFTAGYEFDYAVDTVRTAPTYVTYAFKSYTYLGGAHGGSLYAPATFSTADGSRLTWDNLIETSARRRLIAMIRRGLSDQFFTAEGGVSMKDGLLIDPDSLDLPRTSPSLDARGLLVIYRQYEIAPYACGMPSCSLPLDSVRPLLTPHARRLAGLEK